MIKTYKYINTPHSKLHEFVMAFFSRIEFETGVFDNSFYEKEFYDVLICHHVKILGKRFKDIYTITKTWKQAERTKLCKAIRESNDIKSICVGKIKPLKSSAIPASLKPLLHDLFICLYENVIKGKYFIPKYGSLKEHYHACKRDTVNDFEYCPACGIVEMKTYDDKKKDQHDHYLPKDVYPFSSVNFENLVPICADCNSIEVKSNKDILSYSGVVFFPFDDKHKGIEIAVKIRKNDPDELSKIQWDITYSNKDGKNKEITAWKKIYNVEDRHQTHVTGNIDKWYKRYHKFINNADVISKTPDENVRKHNFLESIKERKELEYGALSVLIDSFDIAARDEAKKYSRY
jgi:hypothetical protein